MIAQWLMYLRFYYYVYQWNSSFIIPLLFKNMYFLEEIEGFINNWGWHIVFVFENGGQAPAENVGQLSEVSLKSGLLKRLKKIKYYNLRKNWKYLVNTKGEWTLLI